MRRKQPKYRPNPVPPASLAPVAGSAPLDFVQALRDQATKYAEIAARARNYSAAANWQAWSEAYDHLLVTVRSQSAPNT